VFWWLVLWLVVWWMRFFVVFCLFSYVVFRHCVAVRSTSFLSSVDYVIQLGKRHFCPRSSPLITSFPDISLIIDSLIGLSKTPGRHVFTRLGFFVIVANPPSLNAEETGKSTEEFVWSSMNDFEHNKKT